MNADILCLLKNVPLFKGVSSDNLNQFLRSSRLKEYKVGDIIIHQDDISAVFYLIITGEVKVVRYSDNGDEVLLDVLSRGQYFGEMSLLDGRPRSASVVVLADCTLLSIERRSFLQYLQTNIQALEQLLKELSRRLREADLRIEDISTLDLTSRLKKTLLTLAKKEGQNTEKGLLLNALPTHQNLANMIGASRARVSEALSTLKEEGFIRKQGDVYLLPSG